VRAVEIENPDSTLRVRVTYALRRTGAERTDTFSPGGAV